MSVALLLIDPQNDFVLTTGALSVPGAIEDMQRTLVFINTNIDLLDEIFVTQDWHQKEHIAHASWWQDENGNPPEPFTKIAASEVVSGKWKTKNPDHQQHSLEYIQQLEAGGKYTHTIWPEHCIQDTFGAQLPDNLQRALEAWEQKSGKKVTYIKKGMNSYTEQFSALKAEIVQANDEETGLNKDLIAKLDKHDLVLVAGQALSHCVAASTKDLIAEETGIDPKKVRLLTDCCSNVTGCQQLGDDFLKQALSKGVTFAQSTMSLSSSTKNPTADFTSITVTGNGNSDLTQPLLGNNGKDSKKKNCCVML
jgi:nicotinamidase-related amidase